MSEIAQDFQNLSFFLQGWLLYVPGVLMLLAGLWAAIAGTSKIRIFSGFLIGVISFVVSLFLGISIMLAGVFAVVGFIAGAALPKLSIVVSSIIFSLLVAVIYFAGIDLKLKSQISRYTVQISSNLDTAESLKIIQDFALHSSMQVKKIIENLDNKQLIYIAGIAIAIFLFGAFFTEVIIRLFCAAFGVALCWNGMFLLLCYKGTDSLNIVLNNKTLYSQIFAAMILVGFLIQLIFIPIPKIVKKENKIRESEVSK